MNETTFAIIETVFNTVEKQLKDNKGMNMTPKQLESDYAVNMFIDKMSTLSVTVDYINTFAKNIRERHGRYAPDILVILVDPNNDIPGKNQTPPIAGGRK
jgi:hypothetical protein